MESRMYRQSFSALLLLSVPPKERRVQWFALKLAGWVMDMTVPPPSEQDQESKNDYTSGIEKLV
jgi:hypothetical protein